LECGIELVTHPFTMTWLKENEQEVRQIIRRAARECSIDYTCGMHVHMDRSNLSPLHQYRMLKLVMGNRRPFSAASRREEQELESYAAFRLPQGHTAATCINSHYKKQNRRGLSTGFRFSALNVCNLDTLEFRLFHGTLDFVQILSNLKICESIWEFTKECALSAVTYENYFNFVQANRAKYDEALLTLPTT